MPFIYVDDHQLTWLRRMASAFGPDWLVRATNLEPTKAERAGERVTIEDWRRSA